MKMYMPNHIFSESQILHKPIYNKWTSKWNNKILERWSKTKDDTIFIIKSCTEKFLVPMGYSLSKFITIYCLFPYEK